MPFELMAFEPSVIITVPVTEPGGLLPEYGAIVTTPTSLQTLVVGDAVAAGVLERRPHAALDPCLL
jgi:hypothetical protein